MVKVLQKLGKADETKDLAFEEGVINFNKQLVRFLCILEEVYSKAIYALSQFVIFSHVLI